jgi:hypothetical protein
LSGSGRGCGGRWRASGHRRRRRNPLALHRSLANNCCGPSRYRHRESLCRANPEATCGSSSHEIAPHARAGSRDRRSTRSQSGRMSLRGGALLFGMMASTLSMRRSSRRRSSVN